MSTPSSSRPFAHRLGHRVARDQQDREENGAQDRRNDGADVAELLGKSLNIAPSGSRLGFGRRVGKFRINRGGDLGGTLGIVTRT